jgi:hypothetical protein
VLGAALAVVGCANATPSSCPGREIYDGQNDDLLLADARERLAALGLTPTKLFVETRRQNRRRPILGRPGEYEDDDYVVGYLVWADTAECPDGKVVLRYDSSCFLRDIYTRYGCQVEGLPQG